VKSSFEYMTAFFSLKDLGHFGHCSLPMLVELKRQEFQLARRLRDEA
jgi:hypothetical protein